MGNISQSHLPQVLKDDEGSLVMRVEEGVVRKEVRGLNKSGLRKYVNPGEMVDREQRALELLAGLPGIKRVISRIRGNVLLTEYLEGTPIRQIEHEALPIDWSDQLLSIVEECAKKGVYPFRFSRSDVILRPDKSLAIIDFGDVVLEGDKWLSVPGVMMYIRSKSLRRIRKMQRAVKGEPGFY